MSLLQRSLVGNAVFSLSAAVVALAGAVPLARSFGIHAAWLLVVGAGLAPFGLAVLWLGSRRRPSPVAVRMVVAMDVAWVVGAAAIVVTPGIMSAAGRSALAAVSVGVAGWAVMQMAGLRGSATGS